MASHCRLTLEALTEILGRVKFLNEQSDPQAVAEMLIMEMEPAEQEVAREELAQLPTDFMPMLIAAWNTATDAGAPFSVESEAAPKPQEWAKAGRIGYRIEHDREGVRFYVAHVHGHHAEVFTR